MLKNWIFSRCNRVVRTFSRLRKARYRRYEAACPVSGCDDLHSRVSRGNNTLNHHRVLFLVRVGFARSAASGCRLVVSQLFVLLFTCHSVLSLILKPVLQSLLRMASSLIVRAKCIVKRMTCLNKLFLFIACDGK